MASTRTGTTAPTRTGVSRLYSLDVLRGIAILGTFGTNVWMFTTLGMTDRISEGGDLQRFGARTIETLGNLLTNGRFLALLSLLFGVGMAILFESAQRRGHRWPLRYWWRSALLVADGFIHYLLVVDFDILMGYGLTALLVAPLLLLRGWRFALAGLAFAALHLVMEVRRTMEFWAANTQGRPPTAQELAEWAREVPVAEPGYWTQVADRLDGFWGGRQEAFIISPPLSATLFMVGVALWRRGVFTDPAGTRRIRIHMAVWGLGVGVGLSVLPMVPGFPTGPAGLVEGFSRYTIAPIQAVGYLGLGLLILDRRGARHGFLSRRLADVGRMALSCYLLQNIVALIGFSGWGLHLGPLGAYGTLLTWVTVSALMMLFANLWLRHHDGGPFETVWRHMSDGPFRDRTRGGRAPEAAPAVSPGR